MFRKTLSFIVLPLAYAILWIAGMLIASQIIPSGLMSQESESGSLLPFLLVSSLNTAIILIYIYNSTVSKWKLVLNVFILMFGLQFFMAQIESIWFNNALQMEENAIYAIILGGFIGTLVFSILSVTVTGKFKGELGRFEQFPVTMSNVTTVLLLAFIIWPIIYFLAGYYIAWQFESVRVFYSDSPGIDTFAVMMERNIADKLYFFQMIRGLLWLMIAGAALFTMKGSVVKKAVIVGLLLSILSSSQLLIENPVMPEGVRMAHLLETSTSNFIWGVIICYGLSWSNRSQLSPEIATNHSL